MLRDQDSMIFRSIHFWAVELLLSVTLSIFAPAARGQVLQSLYSFAVTNGYYPYAGLVEGSDGNFYGTTYQGGTKDSGTVFNITPDGVWTSLVSFNGANGAYPSAGLLLASDGNFYGTTESGGANNLGTVFKMTPALVLTTLVSFNGTNGSLPQGQACTRHRWQFLWHNLSRRY